MRARAATTDCRMQPLDTLHVKFYLSAFLRRLAARMISMRQFYCPGQYGRQLVMQIIAIFCVMASSPRRQRCTRLSKLNRLGSATAAQASQVSFSRQRLSVARNNKPRRFRRLNESVRDNSRQTC